MMDILDKFINQARENIATGYYKTNGKAYSVRKLSLKQKFLENEFSLIAEIKHASPAGEYSFDNIDPEKTALTFRDAGADAISVVVEPKIFKGDLKNIPLAKKSGLPILFKDFIISKVQIDAAKFFGADAVLLVVKVFDRVGLDIQEFISYAHNSGLEVLLECYDETEAKKALNTDADILGINNRDLSTLKVDLSRTAKIMEKINFNRPIISESGVNTHKDSDFLKSLGVSGILVGTAIWKSSDITKKIKELKGD